MMKGWLVLDKPQGVTSTRVGSLVKKLLNVRKIGHIGTLDPMATGVLILALNEATKLIPYVEKNPKIFGNIEKIRKEYEFDICFGKTTDTYDADGVFTHSCKYLPAKEEIEEMCKKMTGEQEQTPPLYSALKIQGKRLCDLARAGIAVTIKKRRVNIDVLQLITYLDSTHSRFRAVVSQGTYIRSLAYDMACNLHTWGYITHLRRVSDGLFHIHHAISLEKLEELVHKGTIEKAIIPIGAVLGDIPAVSVSDQEWKEVQCGRKFLTSQVEANSVVRLLLRGTLVGMGYLEKGFCFPKRVLQL